jgi:hypothetical protein
MSEEVIFMNERQEAIERGFKTTNELFTHRCKLKHELRAAGITFDKDEPTKDLEAKHEAKANSM